MENVKTGDIIEITHRDYETLTRVAYFVGETDTVFVASTYKNLDPSFVSKKTGV